MKLISNKEYRDSTFVNSGAVSEFQNYNSYNSKTLTQILENPKFWESKIFRSK